MDRLTVLLTISLLLLITLACGSAATPRTITEQLIGKDTITHVSILDFPALESRLYTTSDSTYVVNFWAMWCAPCVKELPLFEEYLARHSGSKTGVLLVSMDFPDDIVDKLIPFLNRRKVHRSDLVLLDAPNANAWIDLVDSSWSGAIPATLIFNRDTSVFLARPFADLADLERAVRSINN